MNSPYYQIEPNHVRSVPFTKRPLRGIVARFMNTEKCFSLGEETSTDRTQRVLEELEVIGRIEQNCSGLNESYTKYPDGEVSRAQLIHAYPPSVAIRNLPGGKIMGRTLEARIAHGNSMAHDREYMLKTLEDDNTLAEIIDNEWALCIAGAPYHEIHALVFRLPGNGDEQTFSQLTPENKARFLEINRAVQSRLESLYPQHDFIIGVNRSDRPNSRSGINNQSIPILHSHIYPKPSPEELVSVSEAYEPEAEPGSPAYNRNRSILRLRLKYPDNVMQTWFEIAGRGIYDSYKTIYPEYEIKNEGRYVEASLPSDPGSQTKIINQFLFAVEQSFDERFTVPANGLGGILPPQMLKELDRESYSYTWILDGDKFRLGFSLTRNGTFELYNGVLTREGLPSTELTKKRQLLRNQLKEIGQDISRPTTDS